MSPRSSTFLTLLGVLLAGIPLPLLTAARKPPLPATQATPITAATRTTWATLQVSGQATALQLLHEGKELLNLSTEELAHPLSELELILPATSTLELEIIAHWTGNSQAQAITLTLEPDGLPARQCTQWTAPGSDTLHSLFSFIW